MSGLQAGAQLTAFPTKHDFGLLLRADANWVDVEIINNDPKEAFIFRVEASNSVSIQISSKKVLPDSSVYIRIQYTPKISGHFREELKMYASSWQQPKSFVISGESTYAVDLLMPCPDFSNLPGGTHRKIQISVFDQVKNTRFAEANAIVYRDGRKYAEAISDQNGEIQFDLLPGRHFISFVNGPYYSDTTLYIHGFNQHIQVNMNQVGLVGQIDCVDDEEISPMSNPVISGSNEIYPDEVQAPSTIIDYEDRKQLSREFRPSNVVFLVDVSNSMKHEGRLELLKIAMIELLEVLRPTDRFTLICYAAETRVLIETRAQLDKAACVEVIQNLTAGGGTEGANALDNAGLKALQHAIEDGNNQIIIATDGAFNEGAALAKKLAVKYHRKGVVISVLGIKCGKFATSEMSDLAMLGGGRFVAINNSLDAGEKLVDEIKVSSRN